MSGINIKQIDQNNVLFSFANGSLSVLVRNGDLSTEPCDAIVNTTKSSMVPDGGLDALIHQAMGQFFTDQVVAIHKDMQGQSCPDGQSRIFIAKFNRTEDEPRFVISTVGPVYEESDKDRSAFLLQSCYYTSLALANIYQISSIAYPAISCGTNQYPPNEAARIAIDSIRRFSCNIKDVRFILYDRSTFEVFVQEWTDYAQEINKEANYTDQNSKQTNEHSNRPKEKPPASMKSKEKPPVPIKPKTYYCLICKEQPLMDQKKLLCLTCSSIPRTEIFKLILSKLRASSDQSYDDLVKECESLKPILSSYQLIYIPTQAYDPTIFSRDTVAEHYVHQYCDRSVRNCVPILIAGDGNCFYNTFVKLGGLGSTIDGSPLTPVELRARNVIELVLNIDKYRSLYNHLAITLDKFEDYVRQEMVHDTNFVGVWDILSIPSVLNIQVVCCYPKVNGENDLNAQYLDKALFMPLPNESANDQENKSAVPSVLKEVKLLFSHVNRPLTVSTKAKTMWSPNHFVPLLRMR